MRPLLALFVRALRENTRARSTYILRAGIALLIVNLSLRLKWTALPAALGLFLVYQVTHTIASIASFYFGGRRSLPAAFEPALILGVSVIVIFFLIRNTRTLLLRHATEG
jgi:hypothetical protein